MNIVRLFRKYGLQIAALLTIWTTAFATTPVLQPAHFVFGEQQFQGIQIYDVIQDNDYTYWFATDAGLYKYDSYTYTKTECFGMKGTSVFGFVMAANGIIYCHNLNYQIFQIANGTCSIFYELKESERSSDLYLASTSDSSLLVLCRNAILFERSSNKIAQKSDRPGYHGFPFLTREGKTICHIANSTSLLIQQGTDINFVTLRYQGSTITGQLKFFHSQDRTYAVNVNTKEFFLFEESTFQLEKIAGADFLDNEEYYRFYNESGQLWIAGSRSGVRLIDEPVNGNSAAVMFPKHLISDVYRDREGNILLSTFSNGILVIPNIDISGAIPVSGEQPVVSILCDNSGGVLAGTQEGQLLRYRNGIFTSIFNGSLPVVAVFDWPACPFILFSAANPIAYFKDDKSTQNVVTGSLKDAVLVNDSIIYLALNTSTCKLTWNKDKKLELTKIPELGNRSYAVAYEKENELVYTSTADGLKTIRPDDFVRTLKYKNKLIFPACMASTEDAVYAATKQNGILIFRNGEVVGTIRLQQNNESPEVSKMIIRNNLIYAIVNGGFSVYNMDGTRARNLNSSLGFSSDKVSDFDVAGNTIWISHSKGIQTFSLEQLDNTIDVPLLWFSQITVDNDTLHNYSILGNYPSSKRRFRFVVASPTLKNSENIRYHYQLEGIDNTWNIADHADHEFVYQSLPAGNYTLVVKAENQGTFSAPIRYAFTVNAPFWSSWWFNAGAGLLLLLVITLIYKYRLKIQERKSILVNELYASRLTAIQSQMNPHFIFNSLNSIQDLVLKGDIDNSYTFITKFSNLVRRTLNYSDKDFVEFNQEIKLIELYLSLEKLRFKEDLVYTIETGDIDDIMIPPMLIQPFIENSLLHGLLHKEGIKQLHIRFHLNDVLTCTIEDNGIGREKSREIKSRQRADHESFSGEAINKRFSILSKLFNNELGYMYEDLMREGQPSGTRVTLTIPVKRTF